MASGRITFYRASEYPYGCFSNFSKHKVFLKGKLWPTTEHYFQAQKFAGTPYEEEIRLADKPNKAAQMGRSRSKPLRKDWEQVKDGIMLEAVYTKFKQHKDIRKLLLETGSAILVEHTDRDSYWGDGGDGSGKNMLGKTLVIVRERLRKEIESENKNLDEENQKEMPKEIIEAIAVDSENEEDESKEESKGESKDEEMKEANKENSSSEEEEEEEEGNEKVRKRTTSSNKHDSSAKKMNHGRVKARRKREAYLNADGSSKIEKGKDNAVRTTGATPVSFSEKALPSTAKVVVYRNKFRQRNEQRKAEGFVEDDDEDEETHHHKTSNHSHQQMLSDYIKLPAQSKTQETPEYLLSPQAALTATKDTVDFITQLPKDDPVFPELLSKCVELKSVLEEFISQTEGNESLMSELFSQFESVSKIIEEFK